MSSSAEISSDDCQESEYEPSATPESEDYSSCESSSLETPSESSESLADSDTDEIWSD